MNAWIDFNSDGDWADTGEQIFTDVALLAGVNSLSFAVPATPPDVTYARFRLSTVGGLSFDGPAPDGEVEDYAFGTISGSKWNDLDGDGTWDAAEPALAGWTFYVDWNNNGQLDPGEAFGITDASGNCTITGLPPGTHTMAEVLQSGWEQTSPAVSRPALFPGITVPLVNGVGTGVGGADESVLQSLTLGMNLVGHGAPGLKQQPSRGRFHDHCRRQRSHRRDYVLCLSKRLDDHVDHDGPQLPDLGRFAGHSGQQRRLRRHNNRPTDRFNLVQHFPSLGDDDGGGDRSPDYGEHGQRRRDIAAGHVLAGLADRRLAELGTWAPPVTINGQATTGNALHFTSSTSSWGPALDSGTSTPQDFPFIIGAAPDFPVIDGNSGAPVVNPSAEAIVSGNTDAEVLAAVVVQPPVYTWDEPYLPVFPQDWLGDFYDTSILLDHTANPLTIVLDFNDPAQANTIDGFGNEVSTLDVIAYGFAADDSTWSPMRYFKRSRALSQHHDFRHLPGKPHPAGRGVGRRIRDR